MAIHHDDILNRLRKYTNVMYRDTSIVEEMRLRTGDVIELGVADFEKILKSFPILKPLLESYAGNAKYKSQLWTVLNKPCDMVHSESQKFKSNLFLCPLQSFRRELKKEHIFDEYISPPLGMENPADELKKIYVEYLEQKAKTIFPINSETPKKDKKGLGEKRKEFIKTEIGWAWDEVFSSFEEVEKLELYEKSLSSFIQKLEEENASGEYDFFINFIKSLESSDSWKDYKIKYHAMIDGIDEVRINSKKTTDLVQTVFINQMETKGMFYFEPHFNLYSEELCDFSYFIELEDIMTLKLKQDVIDSGELVKLLQHKRKVGLSRNFSDRLQNIMGYFFSKIGTKDVKGSDVLGIYDESFDTFHYDKDSLTS